MDNIKSFRAQRNRYQPGVPRLMFYLTPILICLFSSCFLFKPKIQPYPRGLFFPLTESGRDVFQGELLDAIIRKGDLLYFALSSGKVICWNAKARRAVWEHQARTELDQPLFSGKDGVYFFDQSQFLHHLNDDGHLSWKQELPGRLAGGICEEGALVFAAVDSGLLLALDAASGHLLWTAEADGKITTTPSCQQNRIIFGTESGTLYLLDFQGKYLGGIRVGGAIEGGFAAAGNRIYFGSQDHNFYCFDRNKKKLAWKYKTGSPVLSKPILFDGRVYFTNRSHVLFCLHARNGSVKWWKPIAAQASFLPLVIEDKIILTSRSSQLVGFDHRSGESSGIFEREMEFTSNPVWMEPNLYAATYNVQTDTTDLLVLSKEVLVELNISKKPPGQVNDEIKVTSTGRGFFLPEYEFSLQRGLEIRIGNMVIPVFFDFEGADVVKDFSPENEWTWFPDKGGHYQISVKVRDQLESSDASALFFIEYYEPPPAKKQPGL